MPGIIEDFQLVSEFPPIVRSFPQIRYMGSKYRLLPWIYDVLANIEFETVLDPFSGSGCVSYLFKAMGKTVISSDFLNFCATIGKAIIENPKVQLEEEEIDLLINKRTDHPKFIQKKFKDIFFTLDDLKFLDQISHNIHELKSPYKQALAISSLIRSSVKRQPRGVFTVAGDPEKYKDGRRDLRLTLKEHFREQVTEYNKAVFSNGKDNKSLHKDIFDFSESDLERVDLVYLDPPYIPRSDDNCYIKRYHFLEGLSCYWDNMDIVETSKVKKIKKKYTPFSYKRMAFETFGKMFSLFSNNIIVLSYSSNGYPNLDDLVSLMRKTKKSVEVFDQDHRYHFGTHSTAKRNKVKEYLIIGF